MKKAIAIILCLFSIIPAFAFSSAAEEASEIFSDVQSGRWYTEAINWAYRNGYMSGTSETEFSPNAPATREEFVGTLFMIGTRNFPEVLSYNSYHHAFSDVDNNSWYGKYIEYAFREDCIAGIANGKFGVGLPIKRQDAAVILASWLRSSDDSLFGFDITDLDKASEYAKESIRYVCSCIHYMPSSLVEGPTASQRNPIFTGNEFKQFMPHKDLTRAELATIAYRLFVKRYS